MAKKSKPARTKTKTASAKRKKMDESKGLKKFSTKRKSLKGTYKGNWYNTPLQQKRRHGEARKMAAGANCPPDSSDEDIAKVPQMPKEVFIPEVPEEPLNQLPMPPKSATQLRKEKEEKERKEKRKAMIEAGELPKIPVLEVPKKDKDEEEVKKLPNQMPGEKKWDYYRRLDKAAKEQLKKTSTKLTSENQRQKRQVKRKQEQDYKEGLKKDDKVDAEDGLFVTPEKAEFGDVVTRPPILSDVALQSRSKLKKPKSTKAAQPREEAADLSDPPMQPKAILKSAAKKGPPGSYEPGKFEGRKDLADLAAKVRASYAAMKRRQREERR